MRAAEARRRLRTIGWRAIQVTSRGHDIWAAPGGERRMFSLGHPGRDIDRNAAAAIIQAERVAAYTADQQAAGATPPANVVETVLSEPTNGTTPEPAPLPDPKLAVFRSRSPTSSVLVYLGQAELDELGGLGARVSVLREAAGWVLRRNPGGRSTVRRISGGPFGFSCRALGKVIKPTGKTELLAERHNGGFLLYPDLVAAMPHREDMAARRLAQQPIAKDGAQAFLEALKHPVMPDAPPQELLPPPSPPKATLDDLRVAIERMRMVAQELGAELYIDPDGVLRAKVTLEI